MIVLYFPNAYERITPKLKAKSNKKVVCLNQKKKLWNAMPGWCEDIKID